MPQNDTEAALDGQLELRKRSRRRLVGAAALALLAAIVLPMVMDGEPRQPVQDVQVRIPSQDSGGFASRILPAKPAVTPLPPIEVESKPEQKPETKPSEATKTDSKPQAKEPVQAPVVADKPAVAAPAKPDDKPTDKPADKQTVGKAEEARVAAAPNGVVSAEQWIVQLGAYKEAANVKQLTAKLKQMGLPSYAEHFDSPQGSRTRVRAGPFKTKEAAEKAQVRLKKMGVDGQVARK
jgi:DedD protein